MAHIYSKWSKAKLLLNLREWKGSVEAIVGLHFSIKENL